MLFTVTSSKALKRFKRKDNKDENLLGSEMGRGEDKSDFCLW